LTELQHQATPDQHSTIVGGSSASRILGCPGSVDLLAKLQAMLDAEADAIEVALETSEYTAEEAEAEQARADKIRASLNRSSSYADEGTGLHEVMAYLVPADIDPLKLITDTRVDELFAQYDLHDDRFFDAVVPAYTAFLAYLDSLYDEAEAAGFPDAEISILVEQRVGMPGIDGAFGTADIIIRTPVRSAVWDWKFGAGVPVYASYRKTSAINRTGVDGTPEEPEADEVMEFGNDQLTFYGRAAQATHPEYFGDHDDWPVDLIICQPRIGEGEPSIYHSTIAELEEFRLDLIDAVDEALSGSGHKAKGSYCRFAECKSICSLHLNGAEAAAEITSKLSALRDRTLTVQDLKDAKVEYLPPTAEGYEREVQTLSMGEAYAIGLEMKEALEPMLNGLAADAQAFMEAGGIVPGHKLVPKKPGHDGWEDPDKAEKFLGRQGLPLEERRVTKPITPAVARTKLKALGKLDEKGAKVLAKYVRVGVSSGHTLAPVSDARQEIQLTSAAIGALAQKLASL